MKPGCNHSFTLKPGKRKIGKGKIGKEEPHWERGVHPALWNDPPNIIPNAQSLKSHGIIHSRDGKP